MHHSSSSSVLTTMVSTEDPFSTSIPGWERKSTTMTCDEVISALVGAPSTLVPGKSTGTTCDEVINTSHAWQGSTVTSSVGAPSTEDTAVGSVTAIDTAPYQSHVWLGTAMSTTHEQGQQETHISGASDGTAVGWAGTGIALAPTGSGMIINSTCSGCWYPEASVLPTHLVTDDSPSPLPVAQVSMSSGTQISLRLLALLLYMGWVIHGHGRV